jgi:hypothetical protein
MQKYTPLDKYIEEYAKSDPEINAKTLSEVKIQIIT